jgi:hypothetical protein
MAKLFLFILINKKQRTVSFTILFVVQNATNKNIRLKNEE